MVHGCIIDLSLPVFILERIQHVITRCDSPNLLYIRLIDFMYTYVIQSLIRGVIPSGCRTGAYTQIDLSTGFTGDLYYYSNASPNMGYQ